MPAKVLTADTAKELAILALNGQIATIQISKRVAGKHKGKFFVEYTTGSEDLQEETRQDRTYVAEVFEEVEEALRQKCIIHDLKIVKTDKDGFYHVSFARENRNGN